MLKCQICNKEVDVLRPWYEKGVETMTICSECWNLNQCKYVEEERKRLKPNKEVLSTTLEEWDEFFKKEGAI